MPTKNHTPKSTSSGKGRATSAKLKSSSEASKSSTGPVEGTHVQGTPIQSAVDEAKVQATLAGMDGRDRWQEVLTKIEHLRQKVDAAANELVTGGVDASKTVAAALREASEQLRVAISDAVSAMR